MNGHAQISFVESSAESNIEHVFVNPELMGGGISIFDLNNDGLEDLYFTGGAYEDKLYKNLGNGTFEEIGSKTAIYDTRVVKTMAVTTGDIDNDGYKDIFVTSERDDPSLLFYNNGDETFTNISLEAGITETGWGMGALFIDINNDGYLDIYVINYIQEFNSILDEETKEVIGFAHDCRENYVYQNNGDLTFTEVGDSINFNSKGCGLAITTTDLNNDHVPDAYIANDFGQWIIPNQVFVYDTLNSQFSEMSEEYELNHQMFGMGIATGDYDRDGQMDYYVSNIGSNVLAHNNGNSTFTDRAEMAGVLCDTVNSLNSTSWGTAFVDVDNNGWEELYVANGYIPAAKFIETSQVDPDKLFVNQKDGTFSDISADAGINYPGISRGMAYGDLNRDGLLDIVINVAHRILYNSENAKIYMNQTEATENNWIGVNLTGIHANRDGIGSRLQLYLAGEIQVREYSSGGSHASQHSSIIHFGMGDRNVIDSLIVTWPGGKSQVFKNISDINQVVNITEDQPKYEILGCMDPEANNYNSSADVDYGCMYTEKVTGLDNKIPEGLIKIYPNPASDLLRIRIDDLRELWAYIIDNTGHVLIREKMTPGKLNEINLNGLSPGLYHLKLQNDLNEVYYSKVIIQ
jgi:hypothetical protein